MRDVKRLNPGARVVMKFDALEVGGVSPMFKIIRKVAWFRPVKDGGNVSACEEK